jgi:hypothetical protein
VRILPRETYRLEAKQEGYATLRQEFTVPDGALSGEMTLQEGVQSPLTAIDPDASLAQNVANVAGATVEAVCANPAGDSYSRGTNRRSNLGASGSGGERRCDGCGIILSDTQLSSLFIYATTASFAST